MTILKKGRAPDMPKRNFLNPTTNAGVEICVPEIGNLRNLDFLGFPQTLLKIRIQDYPGDQHSKITYASAVKNKMMFPVVVAPAHPPPVKSSLFKEFS